VEKVLEVFELGKKEKNQNNYGNLIGSLHQGKKKKKVGGI